MLHHVKQIFWLNFIECSLTVSSLSLYCDFWSFACAWNTLSSFVVAVVAAVVVTVVESTGHSDPERETISFHLISSHFLSLIVASSHTRESACACILHLSPRVVTGAVVSSCFFTSPRIKLSFLRRATVFSSYYTDWTTVFVCECVLCVFFFVRGERERDTLCVTVCLI